MQLCPLAALLILQCWIPVIVGDSSNSVDTDSFTSVGTINVKGSKLRVYEIDGAQVAEPRVSFGDSCDSLRYNRLYLKYQLTLPINIDVNTLKATITKSSKVGQVTLTRLKVIADEALASKDSKVTVMVRLTRTGEAQLIFLCDTFTRCQGLKDEVISDPEELWSTVQFVSVGRVGSKTVTFSAIRSANAPKFTCTPGRWVVFQRRVDGSLSFAQNWDAYVKGFGNPKSNYWMGLDQLFAMTVTSMKGNFGGTSRCQLRVEVDDFSNKSYWGQYNLFEVLGPEHNYSLRIGQEVSGSQLVAILTAHNEQQFSTYDRDHDTSGHSCSQLFGYGGWWYGDCHMLNLNGAYTTAQNISANEIYNSVELAGRLRVRMKRTLMKFKCD